MFICSLKFLLKEEITDLIRYMLGNRRGTLILVEIMYSCDRSKSEFEFWSTVW